MDHLKHTLEEVKLNKDVAPADTALMTNPAYVNSSGEVVKNALNRGFDVLQLENGDIVTTGTKIIVTRYSWNEETQEMTVASEEEQSPPDID